MTAPSITRRLILTLTAGAAALWLLGAMFAIAVVRNELQQTLDGGLRETAERILPLAVDGLRDDHDGDVDGVENYQIPVVSADREELVVYQVREPDGRLLLQSHDAPSKPFATPLVEGFATEQSWRIYTTSDHRTGLFIQVAESEERRSTALWGSVVALLLPLALLIPLGALGIGLAVRSGLAPLRRVGDEVARRDAGNLASLEVGDTPSELAPMTASIDGLLQRLRAAVDAERALAANSAHELRTPIAGSLAQAQRLVEELADHPAQARALRVEDSLHRLSALAAKLLALSRAESGTARTGAAVDLLPALRLIVDEAAAGHEHHVTIKLELPADARLFAPMDVDAFGITMRNLIENASLHGASDTPVSITVPRPGVVEVTSAGQIVPAATLARLAQRFSRGETEARGSGIGLTIVDTMMQQVGGRLELLSPGAGRADGFTARLVFSP